VYGDYTVFSELSGPETPVALPHVEPECFQYFITTQNVLHGCTLIIPTSAFTRHGQFNEELRTTQDYDLWFRMAKTEKFIHLPGAVVRSRYHAEQGTRRMQDVMMTEADELLTKFVEGLTLEQIERGASCHPILGYREIAGSLYARNFRDAAARAEKLADTMVKSVLESLIGEDTRDSQGPVKAEAVHAIRVEVAAASKLRLDRFSLEQESEVLHAEASSLHAQLGLSRSEVDSLNAQLGPSRSEVDSLNAQLGSSRSEVDSLNAQLGSSRSEVASLNAQLEGVYASWSWRITRPLRFAARHVLRCFVKFREQKWLRPGLSR